MGRIDGATDHFGTVSAIFRADTGSLYFLWECSRERVINLGGRRSQ